MRSVVRMGVLLLVILGLGACMGRDGQPYLMFDWTYAPDEFSTTAPGIPVWPVAVYPAEPYATDVGTWYADYWHYGYNDPAGYYIIFTITHHEGGFLQDGDDSLFEIYMYRGTPPTFLQYYSLTGAPGETAPEGYVRQGSIRQADKPIDRSGYERQPLGAFEQIRGAYKMTATYGVYVPKK